MRASLVLFYGVCGCLIGNAASGNDWLQFQANAANHGRAGQAVEPPYQLRWVWYGEDNVAVGGRPFPPGEAPRPPRDNVGLLSFTMHPVVADGRVVFGDLEGSLYCLSSTDGATIWKCRFPGAFLHAPAIWKPGDDPARNVIVAACQDGRLYGLSWEGEIVWSVQAQRPFVTPPKLDGATAFAGSLDGVMYAVDLKTGKQRWTYNASAPIRQPAAIAGGCVFFGSEKMIFQALDAQTGQVLWKTRPGQLQGQSFRNTWPVVVNDRVMTFQVLVNGESEYILEALLFNATPGDHRQKRREDWWAERDAVLQWLAGDMTYAVDCNKYWQADPGKLQPNTRGPHWAGGPSRKSFFVFSTEGDGSGNAVEPFQVPMGIVGGTGNANMGPTLDAQGRPITWWRVSARALFPGGSFGTAFSPDLSALDLATGDRIILPTSRDSRAGGPGMELDNHHMLTTAGDYVYYHNPFRQARWMKLDGENNPSGTISVVYGHHDGGGWNGDVVYYRTKEDAGSRSLKMFDSHGAARTPVVIADGALFVNELDLRALACYEPHRTAPPTTPHKNRPTAAAPAEKVAARQIATEQPLPAVENYVWEKQIVERIPVAAEDLRRILAEEVREVLAAGHLLPYYTRRGELHSRWYFTNPGDTIAALSRAYPYLPEDLQPALREYLKAELTAYPPFERTLNAPHDKGRSRNGFVVPTDRVEWNDGKLYRSLPRVHNVYSLWLYADATQDADYIKQNWPAIKQFYQTQCEDIFQYFGGASAPIGLSRLARLVSDSSTEQLAIQDAAAALQTLHNEPNLREPLMRRHGLDSKWAAPFTFAGFHWLELTPETARYLRNHPALYDRVTSHVNEGVAHWPMWYVSQASAFTRYYGESHALPPDLSKMIFPVKALVERADPENLRKWVDAEDAPLGDWFFLERLVLALEAHGAAQWRDVR
jgi:hypothetical protein